MSKFQQDIIRLLSSRHYKELATYRPPFQPWNVLGITHRELSFSSVLAWLLSDSENKEFRHGFLLSITRKLGLNYAHGLDEPIIVRREYGYDEAGRIDVFVQLKAMNLVIAIEVKVHTGEGDKQILRYQKFLRKQFPQNKHKVVVFITPSGRLPTTAGDQCGVRVLPVSWETIVDILEDCTGHGEIHNFRVQFSKHLRRSVLMHRDEKQIVIDFLKEGDNAKTIRRMMKYFPDLGEDEYAEKYKRIVAEVLCLNESDLKLDKYPSTKGKTKELKIEVKAWNNASMPLPFTLMLCNKETLALRLLTWSESYEQNADSLKNFSRTSNGVVGNFPKVAGWSHWRSVLASDGDQYMPRESIIDYEFFHDEFWGEVKEKLHQQIAPLLPLIQDHLAGANQ